MVPINGWLDFTLLDWPGRIASAIFLPGCNFRCPFCHNHRLLEPAGLPEFSLDEVLSSCRRRRGWIDGIVVSGGEPTLHPGLPRALERIKAEGLGVKLDTNGSRPEILEDLMAGGLVDHVAMDIKAPLSARRYSRLAGVAVDLKAIRRSIDLILSSGLEYTFRTTAVPVWLTDDDLRELALELRGARELVLQDFRAGETLDPACRDLPPRGPEEISRLSAMVGRILAGQPPEP